MQWRHLTSRGNFFLQACDSYAESRLVLIGAPLDLTSSFRSGSREGPQAIRLASDGLEDYSPYLGSELGEVPFYDAGDLELPLGNLGACLKMIEEAGRLLAEEGKIPFFLGGEHLITLPLIRGTAARYPDLAVLHFDAHADLRSDYLGEKLSHATVMRRVSEVARSGNIYQFGIRSGTREEFRFGAENTHFHPFEILPGLQAALPELAGRPVYVTVDIDVVDPAYAPGTGTPEPGGSTPPELFRGIEALRGLRVVGCDLVETAPAHDQSGITALLAAKIVRESLLAYSEQFIAGQKPAAERGLLPAAPNK